MSVKRFFLLKYGGLYHVYWRKVAAFLAKLPVVLLRLNYTPLKKQQRSAKTAAAFFLQCLCLIVRFVTILHKFIENVVRHSAHVYSAEETVLLDVITSPVLLLQPYGYPLYPLGRS